ncbi:hypothetical protein FRC09_007990 [Ceratobasidium sp. 395]|nr:hypothetical protein FRC09_007990 [Ceratobasidium sp. 395]
MPGSLIIEEITYSDVESDVDELADRFSSITDLDGEAAGQDTVIEDYFTTHEVSLEHEGSSSGSEEHTIPSGNYGCLALLYQQAKPLFPKLQHFEDYGIAWGVQWEYRAYKLTYQYKRDDYDEEEAYIRADRDNGLMNEHGGNCHFSEKDGRTHRAAIIKFFASKKLLINGRLFQAFYGHGSKVELMEINEDVGRTPDPVVGDHNRMSFLDFVTWHNNFDLNGEQTIGKWVSRFALGFSTSLVGPTFTHNNIHFIDDIYAPGTSGRKPEAHEIMTDGCGFLNWTALRAIQEKMNWEIFPVHVQARIAGAKGLFVLHPEHQDPCEQPQIWIRSSQDKVKLQAKDSWSPFHYVLDVCSGPFFQQPSSITYEMILCLSARGVPDYTLIELLRKSIQDIANDHEPHSHAHGSQVLWDSIYNIHRVLQNKLRHVISPEQQRAYGFVSYADDEEVSPEENVSAKWDVRPDPNSGMPATAQEQVLGWLQSGFSPTDPWVMEKLVYLQEKLLTAAVHKFRITIPKSLRAHIIPDPTGELAEGEIFFASSQTPLEDSSGFKKHCITGPVIVAAVENYRLWSLGYHDVVVFSTKGDCHLASLLSGGDYDGDNVVLIWDEDITDKFVNSDLDAARLSDGFEKANFDKSKHGLGELVARLRLQPRKLEVELITSLLQGAVANRLEGRYNTFYRNSVYINGLNHPDTIRLGHMFTQCLDSTKSGLMVKPEVLKRDIMRWDKRPPECFVQSREEDESFGTKAKLRRNPSLSPFILDTLLLVAEEETRSYKARLSTRRDELTRSNTADDNLIKPFKDALDRVSRRGFGEDLKHIQSHVEKYRDLFIKAKGNLGEFSPFERHGKSKRKDISIGDRQESARALSEAYNRNLPSGLTLFDDTAVRRVAASYAYYLDKSSRSSKFDFSFGVAWAELCAIKARATGGDFVTLASGYVDSMAIQKKIVKVYREMEMETDSD